jgi:hypothetical protein
MELHAPGYFGAGSRGRGPDIRRFRVKHALRSIEHALILLDSRPSEGIEIAALERIRDDLSILLRSPDVKH